MKALECIAQTKVIDFHIEEPQRSHKSYPFANLIDSCAEENEGWLLENE